MTFFVCPRVVSLVSVSLSGLGIFGSILPTQFIWSLYNQNQRGLWLHTAAAHLQEETVGSHPRSHLQLEGNLQIFVRFLPLGNLLLYLFLYIDILFLVICPFQWNYISPLKPLGPTLWIKEKTNQILTFKMKTNFFWNSLYVDEGKLVRLGASGGWGGILEL